MTEQQKSDVLAMYNKGMSPYEIATSLNTYANKIRRFLIANKVEIRDKSESQSLALKRGVRKHPTAGTKRNTATKLKISEKMTKSWQAVSPEERERRVEQARKQWEEMTVGERELLKHSAARAIRKAAKEGSKLEKFLLQSLTEAGFQVEFHREGLIPNEKLQLDLFIPQQNVAIEVDGPSHFFPIWGEENLKRHIRADSEKTGLLLSKGFSIIRVKCLSKTVSQSKQRSLTQDIVRLITKVSGKAKAALYEIEVK